MAGHDFAHNAAPNQTSPSSGNDALILPVIAVIAVAGICFAAGFWLGSADVKRTGMKTDIDAVGAQLAAKQAEVILQQARIKSLEGQVSQWRNKAGESAYSKVGELSFYKDLPKQSVTPAPVSAKAVAKVKPVAKPAITQVIEKVLRPVSTAPVIKKVLDDSDYRIQLASFRSFSDAMPLQKKMSKSGFSTFIHQVDLGAKGQWFRVYAGPFVSKSEAEDSRQRIEQQMKLKGRKSGAGFSVAGRFW